MLIAPQQFSPRGLPCLETGLGVTTRMGIGCGIHGRELDGSNLFVLRWVPHQRGMTHLFSHRPRSMAPWAVATQNSAQGAKLLRASVVLGRRQMGQTSLFRADQKLGMTHLFSHRPRSMAPWAVATQNSAQGAKLLCASVVLGRRQMGQTSLFRAD
ncbi:hypothetical protein LF1_24410 [Rubripirellula obstinata]|uniref:Uncharacterized protein n=1 Tax=Rubripirellula obstinata TaxID=406547 RepID=A0A5B1CKQ2_9BACT|nr:hypothetical protein LF1_24410 [Rubripirellula obstinata]